MRFTDLRFDSSLTIWQKKKIFSGIRNGNIVFLQNLDYVTLKEVASSLANLWIHVGEEQRLIELFWLSQLPRKENGELVDYRELQEV